MPVDLTSVLAKLRHAERHIDALRSEVVPWLESDVYRIVPQRNDDLTELALVAKLIGTLPDFERWSLMMGDAIGNLRDTLDHLVYAVAQFETRNEPSAKIDRLAFLIVDDASQFQRDSKTRLRHLSAGVISAIESFQPYNRPNAYIRPALAILRDLSNTNKHRIVQLAATATTGADLEFRRPGIFDEPGITSMYMGKVEDGAPLCVFKTLTPSPNAHLHKGYVDVAVAIWHGYREGDDTPGSNRSDYSALFRLILAEVRAIIHAVSSAAV